eukprot:4350945-Lingulodinium_polyedra.AAC.1
MGWRLTRCAMGLSSKVGKVRTVGHSGVSAAPWCRQSRNSPEKLEIAAFRPPHGVGQNRKIGIGNNGVSAASM